MLHQQLTSLDQVPLDRGWRWLVPALVAAVAASGALLFFIAGDSLLGGLFAAALAAMLVSAFVVDRRAHRLPIAPPPLVADMSLAATALSRINDPAFLTDLSGEMLMANQACTDRFGTQPRIADLGVDESGDPVGDRLRRLAARDGEASATAVRRGSQTFSIDVARTGAAGDRLLWRVMAVAAPDLMTIAAKRIAGATGERLAAAGVLAALVDSKGKLLAANPPFAMRALSDDTHSRQDIAFSSLVEELDNGRLRLVAEGENGDLLRAVHVPLDPTSEGGSGTILMFDCNDGARVAHSANIQALLEMMPIGLALVDRDGRFITVNKAFRAAGGLGPVDMPSYPGDLVVKEDKAAVADTVRRHARGPAMSTDLPVRLTQQPGEPVAMTVAGLRNLGEAAVLLLLKDNSEEAKLKRQVAQATKMQAVGQLAGGVAHDFNNILTAIIGHCDLMLMRHTPGDSDYDDIQQIKSNSNRAAGLTRQLLAFSRQQTLRPQVLQLPDVVSEVSHLLKRLLGETVQLVVKHGRDLAPVRADPGQLEQVIVNLAVNARDAMMSKGGGTLTIQTYSVKAAQVADLGSDILPVADYTALSIADTGTGIAAGTLGKVFEPFFTTKEVGKGTGLGLSTVYGIVKQSGGFIFADSKVGEGTRFTIYLPIHVVTKDEEAAAAAVPVKAGDKELWGTGTVLLVEDEPMVRTVAERALTRHGYKVVTATNGEEALDRLADPDVSVDLLISDVVMPLMDGPTMVREARKTYADMPILFMSGYAEEQLRKSIDIEHVAFLPKPFSVQELAEAVRKALSEDKKRG